MNTSVFVFCHYLLPVDYRQFGYKDYFKVARETVSRSSDRTTENRRGRIRLGKPALLDSFDLNKRLSDVLSSSYLLSNKY